MLLREVSRAPAACVPPSAESFTTGCCTDAHPSAACEAPILWDGTAQPRTVPKAKCSPRTARAHARVEGPDSNRFAPSVLAQGTSLPRSNFFLLPSPS